MANAKGEVGVQVVERWIVAPKARLWRDARLRKRQFFSLAEVNAAIVPLLAVLNDKVSRHLGASRRALFEQLDKPALKPLPAAPYEYAEWLERRAGLDYHVEVAKHYYSVPHQLLKKPLWVRLTARTVEVFHEGQRVASHARTSGNRRHTTVTDHMPASHRRHAGITPDEIRRRAARVGPNTARLVDLILHTRTHPEQGFRACLGIVRLAGPHGSAAVEAACGRAAEIGALSYSSVLSILKSEPTKAPPVRARRRTLHRRRPPKPAEGPAITHPNIRGASYFH